MLRPILVAFACLSALASACGGVPDNDGAKDASGSGVGQDGPRSDGAIAPGPKDGATPGGDAPGSGDALADTSGVSASDAHTDGVQAGDGPGMSMDAPVDGPAPVDMNSSTPDAPASPDADQCATAVCSGSFTDGCCPARCNAMTDIDCAGCGNKKLEPGELCDPPTSCAASCPQMGCMKQRLEAPGTCTARCVPDGMQTECVSGDGCCPGGCNGNNDSDCSATCDNGVLEGNEACDPLSSCPQSCPMIGCTKRMLTGSGCGAKCVEAGQETLCVNGDGCCPSACNGTNDTDCNVVCGNGVVEGNETCDPVGSCPTACPQQGCTLRKLLNGGTCTAQCVDDARQTMCVNGDGCCPATCNKNTDSDCPAVCGNGVVEMGETCDPVADCTAKQSACVSDANTVRRGSGDPALCTFVCTEAPRGCGPADNYCPASCGPTQDPDCPGCGNGRLETGETCDPPGSCPTSCTPTGDACATVTLTGSANTCTAACVRGSITACTAGDGCCAPGCTAANDSDCPGCGNGKIEKGETCDPPGSCPTACPADNDACTVDTLTGSAAMCNAACTYVPITACVNGDGCCALGCTAANDNDCAGCGNGVVEKGERCDPPGSCPTSCPSDGKACTSDALSGSAATCTAWCPYTAITACIDGDGCCPAGCNTGSGNLDNDCPAVCGNTRVETGETCDPSTNCPNAKTCLSTCQQIATLTGSPSTCNSVCTFTARACSGANEDGCCPTGCTASTDRDCPAANDQCSNATDISKGGQFPVSLWTVKQDSDAPCGLQGPEAFYAFKLEHTSVVYLDVLDPSDRDAHVPLTIELYLGACPDQKGQLLACDGGSGEKLCYPHKGFPRIDSGGAGGLRGALEPGTYFVAVRDANGSQQGARGAWALTFHHTPITCANEGRLSSAVRTGDLCLLANDTKPGCGKGDHGDANYVVYKCPNQKTVVSTCHDGTTADTSVTLWPEGARFDALAKACVPAASAGVCTDDDGTGCFFGKLPKASSAQVPPDKLGERSGIVIVNIDNANACLKGGTAPYSVNAATPAIIMK